MMRARITRRDMLRLTAMGGLGLALGLQSCATIHKDINWAEMPDKEVSLQQFDKWFKAYKSYNGINPNLKWGHQGSYAPSWKQSVHKGVSPGIDYRASVMYAIAPCYITQVGIIPTWRTGRAGGNFASFKHVNIDTTIPHTHVFYSEYAHLGKIYPKHGKLISRGEIIADIPNQFMNMAKLMFHHDGIYVDPDFYGENHSYMKYELGDKEEILNMSQRYDEQQRILNMLNDSVDEKVKHKIADREHRPFMAVYPYRSTKWDYVVRFKYLTELYLARPSLFTDMPKDRFEELKADFYANQSIILTLPFKG